MILILKSTMYGMLNYIIECLIVLLYRRIAYVDTLGYQAENYLNQYEKKRIV